MNRVAIAGVGYSTVGRNTGLTAAELATQAAKAAMEDSGLTPEDIDGLCSYCTSGSRATENAMSLGWMLGLMPASWVATTGLESAAFMHPALEAMAAVQAGLCDTCLVLRVIQQQPSTPVVLATAASSPPVAGDAQFLAPFGAGSPTQWAALRTQLYMDAYGATEEQFGAQVITQRGHAVLNEDALFRTPLTLDEYLASRYISKPLRLLDCDYPCDSGSAIIVTTRERAADCRKPPVYVEAAAFSAIQDLNFEILTDTGPSSPKLCSDRLWARTDLGPSDVDCAQLYDGFTIITMEWLEALGFCGPGEAGPFVEAGHTALGRSLPVNTDGGACNVGRRHGANFCIEATRQLRGESGERQVPGAEVSIFTNAFGPFAGAVLLTK